jgi:UDP-N-acetylglucosamine--N-acetylmuramyl-(pentapeptide) pyrophosphoryl-undecaprenol N-acetylglucosamine transferase
MNPIVLSAGGTGGHLFPAQALAGELTRRGRSIVVMTDRRFVHYATQFPGAEIQTVPSSPFNAIAAPFKIAAGVVLAFAKLLRLRPAAVIGFGGYPSVPVMLAANLARLPTAIIEQNAVVGRANRLVMNKVKLVAAAFPIARFAPADTSKIVLTGNPLRPEVEALWGAAYAAPEAGGPLRLLVFGGSQGARFFSDMLPPALALLSPELRASLFVVQQCREEDLARVEAAYRAAGVRAHLATFFANLPEEMAKAHLVIGRAGASTVAELTVMGRPAILVPLPHAIDNDQLNNATRLAESGGGWCIEQKELTPERLASAIGRLLNAPDTLTQAAAAARRQGRPDAVARLADLVEELVGSRTKNA